MSIDFIISALLAWSLSSCSISKGIIWQLSNPKCSRIKLNSARQALPLGPSSAAHRLGIDTIYSSVSSIQALCVCYLKNFSESFVFSDN